jgi:hypothetical protein
MRLLKANGQQVGKYGYSDDPHMGTVRYCNVRREDDKVTTWLRMYWRRKYHEVHSILLARLINRIPTLNAVLTVMEDGGGVEDIRKLLKDMRERHPIFGSAYTVSTNGWSMDKIDYILDRVVVPAFHQRFEWSTLAKACEDLCRLNGVSTFMAGQIIADLKNTAFHPLQDAPDWQGWATPGPGSLRGLRAYFGLSTPLPPRQFTGALAEVWEQTRPLLPDELQHLHMQDLQNCMCEFSKYVKVKEGGHVRNRYRAG